MFTSTFARTVIYLSIFAAIHIIVSAPCPSVRVCETHNLGDTPINNSPVPVPVPVPVWDPVPSVPSVPPVPQVPTVAEAAAPSLALFWVASRQLLHQQERNMPTQYKLYIPCISTAPSGYFRVPYFSVSFSLAFAFLRWTNPPIESRTFPCFNTGKCSHRGGRGGST